MTDEELKAIEARARAATKGPWKAQEMTHYGEPGTGFAQAIKIGDEWEDEIIGMLWEDAEFIAHAREDIPNLLAEIRRLKHEQ